MHQGFDTCSCGASYTELKTGLTFAQVRSMMWVPSEDPRDWRYKRRNSVLGYWHQLKLEIWNSLHGGCDVEDDK